MIPNDFGIIRQPNHNLIALLFPSMVDISEYEIELVYPEYIDGGYYNPSGTFIAEENYASAVVLLDKYDYVLLPYSSKISSAVSGLTDRDTTLTIVRRVTSANVETTLYALMDVTIAYPMAKISVLKDYKCPVIGFRRHRSDNVNPKGLTSNVGNILQNSKEDKLNTDTIRRDNLSDNS